MLNLLLLPFRILYSILRTIFFPWYLRWIFMLPWVIYIGLAGVVGFFGYQEYDNYVFERFEAEYQISTAVPAATKLSQWNIGSDLQDFSEVNVAGLYFPTLPGGTFTIGATDYGFVPIADDQGREIKAALVVPPSEMSQLRSFMSAQGTGERIPVTINGRFEGDWDVEQQVANQLQAMGMPGASELVIIEPFMGDRVGGVMQRVTDAWDTVIGFGILGGLLAVLGLGKLGSDLSKRADRPKTAATPAPAAKQTVTQGATKIAPSSGNKIAPNTPTEGSPWGSFQPQPRSPAAPSGKVAPQQQTKTKPAKRPKDDAEPIGDPDFKSVFPGGGSSFRFKTADEIIRETFGTLSVLTRKIDPPK